MEVLGPSGKRYVCHLPEATTVTDATSPEAEQAAKARAACPRVMHCTPN